MRGGERRGGEGEALTCSVFQGIPGPALVGGAGEKPLQVSGSPPFSVEAPLPTPPQISVLWPLPEATEDGELMWLPFL